MTMSGRLERGGGNSARSPSVPIEHLRLERAEVERVEVPLELRTRAHE